MKAVLVFCEGRHDAVFVQRSLGAIAQCSWFDRRIVELPSPFGAAPGLVPKGLIAQRYGDRQLDRLDLRAAGHPPLPSFESVVIQEPSDTLYLMVLTHGKERSDAILSLLSDLDDILEAALPGKLDVDEYATAFLFDADDAGVETTITAFRRRFAKRFPGLDALADKCWVAAGTVPLGCFVFHQDGADTGTLEDRLGPMVESAWPGRTKAAAAFVDAEKTVDDPVSGSSSEHWKAVITVAGQPSHPGDPMSVIIGRGGLPQSAFENSALSQKLVDFLTSVPWKRPDVT